MSNKLWRYLATFSPTLARRRTKHRHYLFYIDGDNWENEPAARR